jgi:hypothetical protein
MELEGGAKNNERSHLFQYPSRNLDSMFYGKVLSSENESTPSERTWEIWQA